MEPLKYDEALLSLPKLDVEDELLKRNSLYISTDPDFDPYQAAQSGRGIPLLYENVIRTAGLEENARFAVVSHYLNVASTLHYHDYLEMIYVPKGKVLNIVNSTPHIMEDNSLLMIKPGTSHLIAPLPEETTYPLVVNMLFHPELVQILDAVGEVCTDNAIMQFITNGGEPNHLFFPRETFMDAGRILNLLVVEYYQNNFRLTFSILGQFFKLLDHLNEFYKQTVRSYDQLTRRCIVLIEAQAATISLESLAQSINYSEGYLSRHIKSQTGKTISQFITGERLRVAERNLTCSDLPISEIAALCGYQSESHFYRVFKQQFHLTPHQYRKIMNQSRTRHEP